MKLRWDPCVVQNSGEFDSFLSEYIDVPERSCLLIGGAGFDPRTNFVPRKFSILKKAKLKAVFFREERLRDQPLLRPRADNNQLAIKDLLPQAEFPRIDIFADGVTAVGGRNAVEYFRGLDYDHLTDIFVDISALSCGLFFPLVATFIAVSDQKEGRPLNVHLLVVEEPDFDHRIRGIPGDTAAMLHGFKGERSLEMSTEEAMRSEMPLRLATVQPRYPACQLPGAPPACGLQIPPVLKSREGPDRYTSSCVLR